MSNSDNYTNDDWHPPNTFQPQVPMHFIEWLHILGAGVEMEKEPELH